MKKKQYLYAISYWFTDEQGNQGLGCAQVTRTKKINSFSNLIAVSDYLKSVNNLKTLIICNIMLLGKAKE